MGSLATQALIVCSQPVFSSAFRGLVLFLGFHLDESPKSCPPTSSPLGAEHLPSVLHSPCSAPRRYLLALDLTPCLFICRRGISLSPPEYLFIGWKVSFFSCLSCSFWVLWVILLEQGLGQDDLKRSLPTSVILAFLLSFSFFLFLSLPFSFCLFSSFFQSFSLF